MDFENFVINARVALEHGKKHIGPALAEAGRGLDDFGKNQLEPFLQNTGVALEEISKTNLVPVMAEVGTQLDEFGKTKLGPAMMEVGRGLGDFRKNTLGPAMGVAGVALEDFGRTKIGPAMVEAGKKLDEIVKNQLVPVIDHTSTTLGGKNQVGPAVVTLVDQHGPAVGEATRQIGKWMQANPEKTALIAATTVTFFLPGIVSSPLLWVFGFGLKELVAGKYFVVLFV